MIYNDKELDEIRKAWDELVDAIGREFYIYKMIDWLEDKLDGII